jgi:hypothetical protein
VTPPIRLLGGRFSFGLDGGFLALEISRPAFAFDGLVVLFAHISLYFTIVFRFCVATMISRTPRFNIYLLPLLVLVVLTGCQSPETKRQKQLATVRVHLEVGAGRPGQSQKVSVLRASPMTLNVEKNPFLNEIHVASVSVVDSPAGFLLSIRFNQKGQWLLEQYTAANPNRRLAIRCQWGVAPDVQDRFVAAPLATHRIKDGVLAFTPDASRDEADQIAIGLNNYAGDTMLKERGGIPEESGGTQ